MLKTKKCTNITFFCIISSKGLNNTRSLWRELYICDVRVLEMQKRTSYTRTVSGKSKKLVLPSLDNSTKIDVSAVLDLLSSRPSPSWITADLTIHNNYHKH